MLDALPIITGEHANMLPLARAMMAKRRTRSQRKMTTTPLALTREKGKERGKAKVEKAKVGKIGREAEEERADRPREAIA